jgi:Xaa-Pro aminopeptidase
MTDVLIVGDTERSPELRHEIPLQIDDPFLYAEVDGRRVAVVWSVEEELGYPTSLSKPQGTVLREGFNHSLGHGVGLLVHEAPTLGKSGHELVVGDVVSLEPGLYRHGFGGVRLEDVVVVTDGGCDTITHYPYPLDPAATVATAR